MMILTDLLFVYHKDLSAFVHHGPIGIANLGEEHVNKYVYGFISIEKTRRGDVFEMLIEPNYGVWYYFKYTNNTFTAISSDETFNQILYELKPNQRELERDNMYYNYGLGSSTYMKQFKKKMYRKFDIGTDEELD